MRPLFGSPGSMNFQYVNFWSTAPQLSSSWESFELFAISFKQKNLPLCCVWCCVWDPKTSPMCVLYLLCCCSSCCCFCWRYCNCIFARYSVVFVKNIWSLFRCCDCVFAYVLFEKRALDFSFISSAYIGYYKFFLEGKFKSCIKYNNNINTISTASHNKRCSFFVVLKSFTIESDSLFLL